MASTLLYLLRTPRLDPLIQQPHSGEETTVVLLHDAVGLQEVPASHVFVLAEDAAQRGVSSSAPSISYGELLDLVFAADRVVVL